jgi:hypothetical protein
MTTFVPLTEADQAYDLVIILQRVAKGITDMREDGEVKNSGEETVENIADIQAQLADEAVNAAKASELGMLVKKGKLAQLMEEFFKLSDNIFACADPVIDAACSLTLSLFIKVATEPSAVQDYVAKFCGVFVKDTTSKVELRLKLLSILFNLLDETSPLRHSVLVHIFEFSLKTNQAQLLVNHLDTVEPWSEQWKLSPAEHSKLLRLASEICQQAKSPLAQLFIFKYLQAVDDDDDAGDLSELAAPVVVTALKHTGKHTPRSKPDSCYEFDVLRQLSAVQKLSGHKKYDSLFKLLNVFASGTVKDYVVFKEDKAQVKCLETFAFDDVAMTNRLRTLTLCSLGAKTERLAYQTLVEALSLSDHDEVEEVVIAAVRTGLLEAKIDQEEEEVVIQRATPRQFVEADWVSMDLKLQEWRRAVEGVISTLHEVRSEHELTHVEHDEQHGY